MLSSENRRAGLLSVVILVVVFGVWQLLTLPTAGTQIVDDEYAALVGAAAATGQKSAFPTPVDFISKLGDHLSEPFYDRGPNDKGIGIQLGYS
ncbi:MAG: nitrate ABC transporter, permease protein, partial [Burkholderiaceae bacterium]